MISNVNSLVITTTGITIIIFTTATSCTLALSLGD